MQRIIARQLSFAHQGGAPVFRGAELHLEPGWTGLAGGNGAGKTTLLRLLAGELAPVEGTVEVHPAWAVVRTCPQEVERPNDDVLGLALASDASSRQWRHRLRLEGSSAEALSERWPVLSPGERKRWQLAAALAAEPDVLLLDEPTNHLDLEGVELLLEALRAHRGIGIIVSHDRRMLDDLTTATIRVHRGEVRLHAGNYSAARACWDHQAEEELQLARAARSRARGLRAQLSNVRRDRAAAAAGLSSRNRMRNDGDNESRSILARGRVEDAEATLSRRVKVKRRELEKAENRVENLPINPEVGRSIFLDDEPCPRPRIVSLQLDVLSAGDKVLARALSLSISRRDRLWIRGANGSGKTTLLSALHRAAQLPPERVLFLPQELDAAAAREALASVRALPSADRGRVLSLIAALGIEPARLMGSSQPSPGEARKLLLARALGSRCWALFLDEPTNHLDLPAIERLEEALRVYRGAIVLVTHDRQLGESITERSLEL